MAEATSNYVGAWFDWNAEKVIVIERDLKTGERFETRWAAPYYFYAPHKDGSYESIFGHTLQKYQFDSRAEFDAGVRQHPLRFESDVSPLDRVLMDNYYGRPTPPVNFAFFDIEVDYKQTIGFAGPLNPYAPINAVTIYQSWTGEFITLAVPPPGWDGTLPTEREMREEFGFDVKPNIFICKDEMELLLAFLDCIEAADVMSGWNSEFFDLPYIIKRIELVLGRRALGSLCSPAAPLPKEKMVERFGTEEPTYRIFGRGHLDYLRLFQKFTFEGRTSYSLANIANEELDIPKLEYEGTLEQLYNRDFKHFVMYNIRDVEVLKLLDEKYKFIALVNQMAHENTVQFDAIMGTVKYVETGITNHAHHVLKKIVHDKTIGNHDKVEGAVVLTPKIGMHDWIGSVDINSLYPNTIRSLNASPEKIIGQFTNYVDEQDWYAIYKLEKPEQRLTLTLESGEEIVQTAAEWKAFLQENGYAISGYGTVFDQSSGRGVVADILGFWYSERKRLQAEKKKWAKKAKELPPGPEKDEARRQEEHFDLLQLTKKISMNSLYGALLNVAFRFGDERLGASVTATGRRITQFMMENIGEILTGEYHPLRKRRVIDDVGKLQILYDIDCDAIIYGDTDSCYYKTLQSNKEDAVREADRAANTVNERFPAFMREAFNCQPGFDDLIKAGREIVGIRGLFQAKKKYMVKVVDLEGAAVDKMKSQGSEIKKADTPKIIQEFMKKTVDMILDGKAYDDVAEFVNQQRKAILKNQKNVFLLGVAKQVNNLDAFTAEYNQFEKPGIKRVTLPGHVRAAINYNELLDKFEKGAKQIRSGDKVLIYYLKPNEFGMKSIAIPTDLPRFPRWFDEHLAVDIAKTEDKMFDNKLGGIFKALGKDIPSPQSVLFNRLVTF